jgi:4-hydroxy-2-oxoheptanedioate aldolase
LQGYSLAWCWRKYFRWCDGMAEDIINEKAEQKQIAMANIKQRLKKGETLHGCWLNTGSPVAAEIIGKAGFDWVLIDLEHGSTDDKDAFHQLQALGSTHASPIARIQYVARHNVQRMLDMGAEGIMFPQVRNVAEARFAIAAMHYPPYGIRGMAAMIRATDFGASMDEYHKMAKDTLLGVIQIETQECLDHLDEIAAIDGVDVLFIGPSDLTLALGIFRQLDHPKYQAALKATVKAARDHGKTAGVLMLDPVYYEMYHNLGFRFLACGADGLFIKDGSRNMVSELNSLRTKFNQ